MAILDSINSKYFSKDIRQYCCRCNVKKYSVFLFILIGTISFAVGNLSCDVANVNIGFYPSNLDWESDEFHIGLWSYRQMRGAPINPASLVSSYMNEQMGPECSAFTNMMESMFFDGDKIWRIIRLASLAALISGAIALLVITCSCCCSIPIDIIWHSLLLPTVSSSLFIGSIVFTMPTIKLCSNRVWQPSGSVSHKCDEHSCIQHIPFVRGAHVVMLEIHFCRNIHQQRQKIARLVQISLPLLLLSCLFFFVSFYCFRIHHQCRYRQSKLMILNPIL